MQPIESLGLRLSLIQLKTENYFIWACYILNWSFHICEWLVYISGEGSDTPLQYPCLENPMDGGAWWAAVHGVAEGRTQLSDFPFAFRFHALEKEWQPIPVFLPGKSQGRGSLVDCYLWGCTESYTTEVT